MAKGFSLSRARQFDPEYIIAKKEAIIRNPLKLWPLILIPYWGWLAMPIAGVHRLSKNDDRLNSERFNTMLEIARKDSECNKIAHRLNIELMKNKPDTKVLKHLRDLYRKAFDDAKQKYIDEMSERYE